MPTKEPAPLMNRAKATKYLDVSAGTLAVWDCKKRYNLKPIKVGRSILKSLGYKAKKNRGNDRTFLSPLRNEKTPSFNVNIKTNEWFDFGTGEGGSPVDFAIAYLKSKAKDHNVTDALRWIDNMQGFPTIMNFQDKELKHSLPAFKLKKLSKLQNPTFKPFLALRGIPFAIAKAYLKEAFIHHLEKKKDFYAIELENENGGYEIRTCDYKSCIAPKGVSLLLGQTRSAVKCMYSKA